MSWDENTIKLSKILQSIIGLGYQARLYDPLRAAEQIKQDQDLMHKLRASGAYWLLIIVAGFSRGPVFFEHKSPLIMETVYTAERGANNLGGEQNCTR